MTTTTDTGSLDTGAGAVEATHDPTDGGDAADHSGGTTDGSGSHSRSQTKEETTAGTGEQGDISGTESKTLPDPEGEAGNSSGATDSAGASGESVGPTDGTGGQDGTPSSGGKESSGVDKPKRRGGDYGPEFRAEVDLPLAPWPQKADRPGLDQWNDVLLELLLPKAGSRKKYVLLCCDDETVRAAGSRLGLDPESATLELAQAVRLGYFPTPGGFSLRRAAVEEAKFRQLQGPRPVPPFLSLLCALVLAATHMEGDGENTAGAYYPRLRELLDLPRDGGAPGFAECIPDLFTALRTWASEDLSEARGIIASLETKDAVSRRYVGECISQTVFRKADLKILALFFDQRVGRERSHEIDLLRLLRNSVERHRLTKPALALIEDDELEAVVKSALETAYRSWDGTVPGPAGRDRRMCRATLVIQPGPPARMGVRLPLDVPVTLSLGSHQIDVEPQSTGWLSEGDLESFVECLGEGWVAEAATRTGGVVSVRISPNRPATVFFALTADGLLQVWSAPGGEDLLALTGDSQLMEELERDAERHYCSEDLPTGWALFHSINPVLLGSTDRSSACRILFIDDAFAVADKQYLVKLGPSLVMAPDADLARDEVTVRVDRKRYSTIRLGQTLPLPASQAGSHEVDVGDGLFRTYYEIVDHGPQASLGGLGYVIGSSVLRRGAASSLDQEAGICGPIVWPRRGLESVPFLLRNRRLVVTIDRSGQSREHRGPRVSPGWLPKALADRFRWEIPTEDVVWLISPTPKRRKRVQCVVDAYVRLSDPETADWIVEIAPLCHVEGIRSADEPTAQARWSELVEQAKQLVDHHE